MHKVLMPMIWAVGLILNANVAMAADPPPAQQQQARPARPQLPGRDPNTPGFVKAKELPDGEVPPADEDGNFIIGPTHKKADAVTPKDGVPKGTIHTLTMKSEDSKFYPGISRERGTFGTTDPNN